MSVPKIRLKNTAKTVELIKAMGSSDSATAMKARDAMAEFIGPIIQQVLNLAASSKGIYVDWPFDEDTEPEFPLDMYYDKKVEHILWEENPEQGNGGTYFKKFSAELVGLVPHFFALHCPRCSNTYKPILL